jgi:curved DNA-binding protein CbpA
MTTYFKNCQTLEEVKKLYKELALKHHPDRGGETKVMQEINAEYESIKKNPFFKFEEQTQEQQDEFFKYPDIMSQIIVLEGILIELIGDWIWISGNTYPHRKKLGELGFYFAHKKVMWYFRPPEYKSTNHKPKSIEEIRAKYGSEQIKTKYNEKVIAS